MRGCRADQARVHVVRQNVQTAHVLGEIEYAVAAFTHGPEIRDDAREQVRGFLAKASRGA